jgi:tetratricopeptide (TPR) repeat protein
MSTSQLRKLARQAMAANDWARVGQCAIEISRLEPQAAEGPFLMGMSQKALKNPERAAQFFQRALELNSDRHDVAIELANQHIMLSQYQQARELLTQYVERLPEDATYLDLAGNAWFVMGHYDAAWPLFERAVKLAPGAEAFQVHKAACAVFLGKRDVARTTYTRILKRNPKNQRIHYELAQLERAKNDRHVRQMLRAVRAGSPADNIFLYYALGKEYEDLEQWENSFEYYKRAGDAVTSVSQYDVREDVAVIDSIIATCDKEWLQDGPSSTATEQTPVFIVGLPRTGTTLTDRILSSHSQVQSAGESQLLQMVLRDGSRAGNVVGINSEQIEAAAKRCPENIAAAYMEAVGHRLDESPFFIEKLPENVLYLGFIAKSWPNAKIVHLRRHPMDACFAMYKQSYFRFAYSLDDLAQYYLGYDRLSRHWRETLGSRMIELHYEDLVGDQEGQTRSLLDELGFQFEEACLNFDANAAPVATASSVQVREKVHTRSVQKWKKFETQLLPLKNKLEEGGVQV